MIPLDKIGSLYKAFKKGKEAAKSLDMGDNDLAHMIESVRRFIQLCNDSSAHETSYYKAAEKDVKRFEDEVAFRNKWREEKGAMERNARLSKLLLASSGDDLTPEELMIRSARIVEGILNAIDRGDLDLDSLRTDINKITDTHDKEKMDQVYNQVLEARK